MGEEPKRLDDCFTMSRYVLMICVLAELMMLPQVSSMFYMVYAGSTPSLHACGADLIFDTDLEGTEACRLYQQIAPGNCSAPYLRYEFKSVNVEWNYFCERANTIKTSISMQMFGVLIGSLVFGHLSDAYGRKKVLLGTSSGMGVCWLFVAKSSTLIQFTITLTIVSFFTGGSIAVLNVFIMENIPKRHRMWINMVITWAPNMIPTAVMAWLAADWRTLALLNVVIGVPGILFCLIRIHESPRWLLQRGKITEACEIMRREFSSVEQPNVDDVIEAEYQLITQSGTQKRRYSMAHLFRSAEIATTTVVLAFSFFSTSIVNYGIMFNMERLSGSIYSNSIYAALMRYICNLLIGYADFKCKKIGRKFVHSSGLMVIISSLAFVIVVHCLGLSNILKEEIRIITLLANSMTSQIYITSGIVGNELFPTPIRNLGFSFLQIWSRMGVIVSPLVFYLMNLSVVLPYCIMTIFCTINMFTFDCLLPETKGAHLENQMPPPERLVRGRKCCRTSTKSKRLLNSEVKSSLVQQERRLSGNENK